MGGFKESALDLTTGLEGEELREDTDSVSLSLDSVIDILLPNGDFCLQLVNLIPKILVGIIDILLEVSRIELITYTVIL